MKSEIFSPSSDILIKPDFAKLIRFVAEQKKAKDKSSWILRRPIFVVKKIVGWRNKKQNNFFKHGQIYKVVVDIFMSFHDSKIFPSPVNRLLFN